MSFFATQKPAVIYGQVFYVGYNQGFFKIYFCSFYVCMYVYMYMCSTAFPLSNTMGFTITHGNGIGMRCVRTALIPASMSHTAAVTM